MPPHYEKPIERRKGINTRLPIFISVDSLILSYLYDTIYDNT